MNRIGVIAGSFDPITNGHVGLIEQALSVVDQLHVVVGFNPSKKYMFSDVERLSLTKQVLTNQFGNEYHTRIVVELGRQELLVNYAERVGAQFLIRGIRNSKDYEYEAAMESINKDISPSIETVFFFPLRDLALISSSTVQALVGFDGWESVVSKYVDPITLQKLKGKEK